MPNQRFHRPARLPLAALALLLVTLACTLISPQPPPTATSQPPALDLVTSTPQAQPPGETPTPLPTQPATPVPQVPPQAAVSRHATSAPDGSARFEDPLSGNSLSVELKDRATQAALPGIEVWFTSNGPQVLVVASDPSGAYAPVVRELSYQELSRLASPYKGAAPANSLTLGTVILMAKFIDLYQTLAEWRAYLAQFPELGDWRTGEVSLCMNPDQLGEGLNLVLQSLVGALLPGGGDEIVEGLMLVFEEAVVEESVEGLVARITQDAHPAIYRVTVFSFNQDTPQLLRFDGLCLDWLERGDPQSILDWLMYGLENADLYALAAIPVHDDLFYANYLEGGQQIDPGTYYSHLKARSDSRPRCQGYSSYFDYLQVWYSNWSPPWRMTEMCYDGCWPLDPPWESTDAAFFLKRKGGTWGVGVMYLNSPANYFYWDDYDWYDCAVPIGSAAGSSQGDTSQAASCPGAPPQQLATGQRGYVCTQNDSVFVRAKPNRAATILTKLPPGTQFDVIAGPKCADDWSWWKIDTGSGTVGWMAEGGDRTDPYFICPYP